LAGHALKRLRMDLEQGGSFVRAENPLESCVGKIGFKSILSRPHKIQLESAPLGIVETISAKPAPLGRSWWRAELDYRALQLIKEMAEGVRDAESALFAFSVIGLPP
jgi:hypothetical protein